MKLLLSVLIALLFCFVTADYASKLKAIEQQLEQSASMLRELANRESNTLSTNVASKSTCPVGFIHLGNGICQPKVNIQKCPPGFALVGGFCVHNPAKKNTLGIMNDLCVKAGVDCVSAGLQRRFIEPPFQCPPGWSQIGNSKACRNENPPKASVKKAKA